MLAFFRLFLKFYLADTPTSKMRSILEVSSEQLQIIYRTISSIFSNPFKEVMSRQLSGYEGSRGLYIGDVFYLVSGNMIESYSMNGFEKMDDIVL